MPRREGTVPAAHGIIVVLGYCWHCGADWTGWFDLSGPERARLLETHPGLEFGAPDDGICPECGKSYEGEMIDDDSTRRTTRRRTV